MARLTVGIHNPSPGEVEVHRLGDDLVTLQIDRVNIYFEGDTLGEFLAAANRGLLALEPGRRPLTVQERSCWRRFDALAGSRANDGHEVNIPEALSLAVAIYPIIDPIEDLSAVGAA